MQEYTIHIQERCKDIPAYWIAKLVKAIQYAGIYYPYPRESKEIPDNPTQN